MCIRSVQMSKHCVKKRMKIIHNSKMKNQNFKVVYLNMACYRQYVDYFKTTFPHTGISQYQTLSIKRIGNKYGYKRVSDS